MTFNTPDESDTERWWCHHCEIAVKPVDTEDTPECPSCGQTISS
ncbi:hypothetical protein [Halonotius terrestris]|nr:hypothetical protein [Halonotius terrestris]